MHALSLVSIATVVCCISVLFAAFTAHYSYSFELLLTFICCLYTIITDMHIIFFNCSAGSLVPATKTAYAVAVALSDKPRLQTSTDVILRSSKTR